MNDMRKWMSLVEWELSRNSTRPTEKGNWLSSSEIGQTYIKGGPHYSWLDLNIKMKMDYEVHLTDRKRLYPNDYKKETEKILNQNLYKAQDFFQKHLKDEMKPAWIINGRPASEGISDLEYFWEVNHGEDDPDE